MAIGNRPVVSAILFNENGVAHLVDAAGINIAANPDHAIVKGLISGGVAGHVAAYVATSATSIVAIRGTAYTEPSSAQQMRLVSANAADTSAGTGARTVRITYYDGSMNGPLTEVVTMNGTTAVNTVATNIRFIEKLETVTAGSGGTNAGIISIQNTAGSTTFGTIAASDGITYWGHHYVQAGKTCFVTRSYFGAVGASQGCFLRKIDPTVANAFEQQITAQFRTITAQPQQMYDLTSLFVAGPARITMYTKPDAVTASTTQAGFSYYEM